MVSTNRQKSVIARNEATGAKRSSTKLIQKLLCLVIADIQYYIGIFSHWHIGTLSIMQKYNYFESKNVITQNKIALVDLLFVKKMLSLRNFMNNNTI